MDSNTKAHVLPDVNVVVCAVIGSSCLEDFHRTTGNRNVSCGARHCLDGNLLNGYGPIEDLDRFLAAPAPVGVPENPALLALRSVLTDAKAKRIHLVSSQYMTYTIGLKLQERGLTNREIKATLGVLKAARIASGGVGVANADSEARVSQVTAALPEALTTRQGGQEPAVDYEDQRVIAAALHVVATEESRPTVLLVTADYKLYAACKDHLTHLGLVSSLTSRFAKAARRFGVA